LASQRTKLTLCASSALLTRPSQSLKTTAPSLALHLPSHRLRLFPSLSFAHLSPTPTAPALSSTVRPRFPYLSIPFPLLLFFLLFIHSDCAALTSCNSCIAAPYNRTCLWCGTSCQSTIICPGGISECPAVTELYPTEGRAEGGELIHIQGGPFSSSFDMNCEFGALGQSPVTFINSSHVHCTTPLIHILGAGLLNPTTVSVAVRVPLLALISLLTTPFQVKLKMGSVDYAPQSFPFNYYDCSIMSDNCDSHCFTHPKCGWCHGAQNCTAASLCQDMLLTHCPVIDSLLPDHTSTLSNETISVTVDVRVNTSSPDVYTCQFGPNIPGGLDIPIDSLSISGNTTSFLCKVPAVNESTLTSTVYINRNAILFSNEPTFPFISTQTIKIEPFFKITFKFISWKQHSCI